MTPTFEYTLRPILRGVIIRAVIGLFDMPDQLYIAGRQPIGTLNRWNLTALNFYRTEFRLLGPAGSLEQHGYSDPAALEGKACLICRDMPTEVGSRLDLVAIEPPEAMLGADWPMVVWAEYHGAPVLSRGSN